MTNTKTEIIAGITTFLTMSYIILLNPSILATNGTGLSFSGVMCATVLISFISTFLIGCRLVYIFLNIIFSSGPKRIEFLLHVWN